MEPTCWKPYAPVVKGLKQVTRLEFWVRLSLQDTDCVKAFEVHVCDSAGSSCRGRYGRARQSRGSRTGRLCNFLLGQCHEMDILWKDLNILNSTFFVCTDGFQGLLNLFTTLYTYKLFIFFFEITFKYWKTSLKSFSEYSSLWLGQFLPCWPFIGCKENVSILLVTGGFR